MVILLLMVRGKWRNVEMPAAQVLNSSRTVAARIARESPAHAHTGATLAHDIALVEVAAASFVDTDGWKARYEADSVGTWQAATAHLESLYQGIHKLKGSLVNLVDKSWWKQIEGSAYYQWLLGKSDIAPTPTDVLKTGAREIAFIDRNCLIRNAAVQHRDPTSTVPHGVVERTSICTIHLTANMTLTGISELYETGRARFGVAQSSDGTAFDLAHLASIAEQVHDLDPAFADAARRAITKSKAWVLIGSRAFVTNLDSSVAGILRARFTLD